MSQRVIVVVLCVCQHVTIVSAISIVFIIITTIEVSFVLYSISVMFREKLRLEIMTTCIYCDIYYM